MSEATLVLFDTYEDEHNRNIRLLLREHKKIPCNKFRQEYNNRFPNAKLPRCNTGTTKANRKARHKQLDEYVTRAGGKITFDNDMRYFILGANSKLQSRRQSKFHEASQYPNGWKLN